MCLVACSSKTDHFFDEGHLPILVMFPMYGIKANSCCTRLSESIITNIIERDVSHLPIRGVYLGSSHRQQAKLSEGRSIVGAVVW